MRPGHLAKIGFAGLVGLSLAGASVAFSAETVVGKQPGSASKKWEDEFSLWQKVSAGTDIAAYESYLKDYPNGTFASMARLRLAELKAAEKAKNEKAAAETPAAPGNAAEDKAAVERNAAEERARAEQAAAEKAKADAEARRAEAERAEAARKAEAERLAAAEKARVEREAAEKAKAEQAAAEKARAEAEARRIEAQKAEAARMAEAERLAAAEKARAEREAAEKAKAEQAAAEKARAEQEAQEAKRQEAERAAAEARRMEAEKAAAAQRAEAERQAAAEKARIEWEAKASERAAAEREAQAAQEREKAGQAAADKAETDATAGDDRAKITAERAEAARREKAENERWEKAVLDGKPAAFEDYLRSYPNGRFVSEAERRLAALDRQKKDDGANRPADSETGSVASAPSRQREMAETVIDTRESYLTPRQHVQVQRWLTLLGFDTYGVDGVFGPRTRDAIAGWQRSNGYRGDGYLTRRQFRSLREAGQFAQARRGGSVVDMTRARRYREPAYEDGYVLEGPVDRYYYDDPYYDDPYYGRGVVIIPGY
ncbi:MAG: peptidoglycan-binding domain-containing protein [Shinella sp.]|nr:peptidoglycan-binding domain-containing protein [Shinella sp.]